MENKIGSIKIDGVVSDSVLIAEVIEYACKNGPYSYFELIENISEKVMECQKGEVSIDTLINGRNPEKHLDVIVRNSKFFKDYFESDANDECHTLEPDWDDEDLIPDDEDDDDFWVQNMQADIEKEKEKERHEKLREEKEAECHCTGDGVCYCHDVEEESQPKKELKDFVWLPNNADQAYREAKAPSQLSQSCQKEAMLVDYVKKLQHEAENLFNEYDVALSAADKIKDDKVNYNYLLGQAFTNKKIAERLADIAADLGHILEEQ